MPFGMPILTRPEEEEDELELAEVEPPAPAPALEAPTTPVRLGSEIGASRQAQQEEARANARRLRERLERLQVGGPSRSDIDTAQRIDALSGGFGQAGDMLRAAFSRRPVQFTNRGPGLTEGLLQQRAVARED